MKYCKVRGVSDPAIVGVRDGMYQAEIQRDKYTVKDDYDTLMELYDWKTYWKNDRFPTRQLTVEYCEMRRHARLTDFLYFHPYLIGCHFMISEKALKVLTAFELPEHRFFPVKVYNQQNELVDDRYHVLCTYVYDFDIIDFSNTSFYTGSAILGKKPAEINTLDEYMAVSKLDPFVGIEKGQLTSIIPPNLDLFDSKITGLFVSERLKEKIESERLSGISFPTQHVPVLERL